MSQVNTSVEVLLKIRQIGEELIAKTKRDMDALASTQGKAGAAAGKAAEGSAALSKSLASQDSLAIKVVENFKRLAAGYLSFATARRAIAASNEAERAELRTLGILQAQFKERDKAIEQLERYKALSKDVAGKLGVFDDDALLAALGRFSIVNPAFANERSLQAAADLAVVKFGGNFDAAAEALADSFVGIGRGLQDVLPALRALSGDEQQRLLKSGGAVDLIEAAIGGSAGVLRNTNLGRQLEATVQFENAMEDVGAALKTVLAPAALIAADAMAGFTRFLGFGGVTASEILGPDAPFTGPGRGRAIRAAIAQREQQEAALQTELVAASRRKQQARSPFGLPALPGIGPDVTDGEAPLRSPDAISKELTALVNEITILQRELGRLGLKPDGSPSGDPNALLGRARVNDLIGGSGALGVFEEKALSLRRAFGAIQSDQGGFPFEAPAGGLGAAVANAERDIDLLFNLALAREKAADTALSLAKAQEELNRSIARTSELVQAGSISEGAGRLANEEAAERFRKVVEQAKAARDESASFSAETTKKLQQFTDVSLPAEPRFITDLTDSVEAAERALETLNRRAQGLSQELSKRLEQPFANLTVATAKGEASLIDFATTFTDTLAQIAAEEAARGILRKLLGGGKGSAEGSGLFGSLFDALGKAFGFGGGYAHGGLVPGADRGRDTTFIAARGQEFVLTPGAARAIGHNRLDSINRAFGGRPSRGAGYSGGGLVDVVAAMGGGAGGGASGGGGLTVLPVLPTDRATIESLFGGDNALVLAELLARNPSARRALSMGGAR